MSQTEEAKKTTKEVTKTSIKTLRDKDRENVRGIFRFHEVPGGRMDFVFKKYKEDPIETFSLIDGDVYTLPLGVARHLNTNCWYPTYTYKSDEAGRPVMGVGEKVRRCSFQSLEFIDIDGVQNVSALPK
jgi:hypothetical protein